jgi:uncharacterized membrane protein YkvI
MKSANCSSEKSLTALRVAFLYFGVLMGAGFASGKEMWQFFGVFGLKGLLGLIMIAVLFVVLGLVIVFIGNGLSTGDLSRIIFPYEHPLYERIIGVIVAVFLFMAYFAMLAAGGALIEAQFGMPRFAGSTVLMFLTVLTTVKGFSTVSERLGKVVPILLVATLLMAFTILFREFGSIEGKPTAAASPLAPNWFIAAVVFVSYNMMGAIPILGSCTLYAEDLRVVKRGAVIGGSFLGGCALILYLVTLTNPMLSLASDLPMLTFAQGLAPAVGALYSVVLLISVFGTATSCFYGYCTKLPENGKKARRIWISAIAGLAVSMMGFSNIVAFLYPLQGYLGFVFLVLMVWNFVRIRKGRRQTVEKDT